MGKTSREKIEKWRKNKENKEKERDRIRKSQKRETMTEEEKEVLKERNRLNKQRSRMKMSKQKKNGVKLIDRNRKVKAKEIEETAKSECSTQRVQEFRKREKVNVLVKMPFNKSKLNRAERRKIKDASTSLLTFNSPSKKAQFVNIINRSAKSSPRTKALLAKDNSNTPPILERLKGRKDASANIARRIITATVVSGEPDQSLRQRSQNIGVSVKTIRKAIKDLEAIGTLKFVDKMKKVRKSFVLTEEVREKIFVTYNTNSRNSPNAKEMILVEGQRTAVKYLEHSLSTIFNRFQTEHPDIKISQSSFEHMRPKNIKLRSFAKRQVCCCMYHVNMEYVRLKMNVLLKCNNADQFSTNESLVSATLCSSDNLSCIEQTCKECGPNLFDYLKTSLVFCSPECQRNSENCNKHTIPLQRFKRQDYQTKKGDIKKKLCLLTERYTIIGIVDILKISMSDFPRHRFNHYHTKEVFKSCKENLRDGEILKIQDFSENYTCLVPDEIQSLHWSQTQATLYPVVVYRVESGEVIEEQLVYISDDLDHNCFFVEFVNDAVHRYYNAKGIVIDRDIEFNDGCSAQYKSIRAFWLFAKRTTKTDRIYFESSHGKGPSDGVGGVTKSLCAAAVSGNKLLIRNAKEMFDFLNVNHTINDRPYKKGHISCRKYFFIPKEEINGYRESLGELPFSTLKGTRQLHQISTSRVLANNQMYVKKYSCLCDSCRNADYSTCIHHETLKAYTKPKLVTLKSKLENNQEEEEDDDDDDESEDENDENVIRWEESDAVQMVKDGDIVVIRSGDNFNPYYLIYARSEVTTLDCVLQDDYGHVHQEGQAILRGNYLEEAHCKKGKRVYFKDTTKEAIISSYCIVGICPDLVRSEGLRRKKVVDYFEINEYVHEVLLGLVTGLDA